MSIQAYCDHVARQRSAPPPKPSDHVELDGIEVLEGEAAEASHRLYFERQQRDQLQRAWELLP